MKILENNKAIKIGLVLGISLSITACDEFEKGFDQGWTQEFVSACVKEAEAAGAPSGEATEGCNCVANDLLGKLDGIAEKADPPIEKINASVENCTG